MGFLALIREILVAAIEGQPGSSGPDAAEAGFLSPPPAGDREFGDGTPLVGGRALPRPHERRERIRREVEMIAPRFAGQGGVDYDEANGDWLMIPKYPLPEKWRARWCKLLIVFPDAYPVTPPVGFYLNRRFRLKSGGNDPHLLGQGYHGAPSLLVQGWYWYCVNVTSGAGGWHPSADYRKPDNLWTYLALVREVLTSGG